MHPNPQSPNPRARTLAAPAGRQLHADKIASGQIPSSARITCLHLYRSGPAGMRLLCGSQRGDVWAYCVQAGVQHPPICVCPCTHSCTLAC